MIICNIISVQIAKIFRETCQFRTQNQWIKKAGFALLFSIVSCCTVWAVPMVQVQNGFESPMRITRIDERIILDGHINEPVWDTIDPLPLVSYEPISGLPPSEVTEIRIAYSREYIHASIRAFDSDTAGIRVSSLYRDRIDGSDFFHILLDTYNDNESAMVFAVTPAGVKWDAIVSNDAVRGNGLGAVNTDYNTYWDVATHINDEGWFAEVRIPLSSIGFQDENGRVVMGLNVQRVIARKNEQLLFPEASIDIPDAQYKASLAQKIVFEELYSHKPVHITPYVSGGLDHKKVLNANETGYNAFNDQKMEAGLDVKYGISNNFNLDLTVNTDFAQVEADNEQVNLTRFNLFFPEKRQFFQERSSIFEFNTSGGGARLFHSRRIGLTDSGEQVRILGGARLTGRAGSWDIGLLSMQTDKIHDDPGENFGVLRLRNRIFNQYSYAGFMGTSRIGMDGEYNFGYGTDGSVRIIGDDYVTWIWAQTAEEETLDRPFFDNSRLQFRWFRETREGISYETTYSRTGPTYNPEAGFNTRTGYYYLGQIFRYGWISNESSPFLRHSLQMYGAFWKSSVTGLIETGRLGPSWISTTKPGHRINASFTWQYENIPDDFIILRRTTIEAGKYNFIRGVIGYEMSSSALFRTEIEADFGSFYDGWRVTMDVSPTWTASKHLEVQLSWLYNLIDVPLSNGWFTEHVGQLRINTALNTHFSTNAFLQMNTSADLVSANVRIRYNFRDGNDLWIVLNEGLNMNRQDVSPFLPRSNSRTLLVKYTYTFH